MSTSIYHFTHIDNLATLLESGCILSKNVMLKEKIPCTSSAFESVQAHREGYPVPVSRRGTIHDYVPFYFNSLSPMLFTINQGNVINVRMKDLVFFKSSVQKVESSGKDFAFTDGHAIMALSDFYDDISDLKELPWEVINCKYWNDYTDGKRLRQSEFLVHNSFDLDLINKLGVYDKNMKERVEGILNDLRLTHSVEVKSNWYF